MAIECGFDPVMFRNFIYSKEKVMNILLIVLIALMWTGTAWASVFGHKADPNVEKYNLGSTMYKNGKYSDAGQLFKQASAAKNPKIAVPAKYNLGNALYKNAMSKENSDLDGAVKNLEEAVYRYSDVLESTPKDSDAQYNKKIAEDQLQRLKKKQQQNKKNQQQQNKDNQENQQQKQDQDKQEQPKSESESEHKPEESQAQTPDQKDNQDKESMADAETDQQQNMQKNEVDIVLEEYERNEQPNRLLNLAPKSSQEQPVSKDW